MPETPSSDEAEDEHGTNDALEAIHSTVTHLGARFIDCAFPGADARAARRPADLTRSTES